MSGNVSVQTVARWNRFQGDEHSSCSRRGVIQTICIVCLLSTLGPDSARAEIVFDNVSFSSPTNGMYSPANNRIYAQHFSPAALDQIDSVTFPFRRLGRPSGDVVVEIWDTDDSTPPRPHDVIEGGELGRVDIASITSARGGELYTIDTKNPVLDSDESFFVVLRYSESSVNGQNSLIWAVETEREATLREEQFNFQADPGLISRNSGRSWSHISIVDGGFEYYRMKLEMSLFGDLNADGTLGVDDINLISNAIQTGTADLQFDFNKDDSVDGEDFRYWVTDIKQTWLGDANVDGEVSFADLLALSENFGGPGGWSEGDFDLNGVVQFPDLLLLSDNFGKTSIDAAAVPEPNGLITVSLGLIAVVAFRSRHQSSPR